MGQARSTDRRGTRALAGVLAACSLLASCGGGVPEGHDPLVSAEPRPAALPPNVGPSDCRPASPTSPLEGGSTQVHGAAAEGASLWAKVVGGLPFPVGRDVVVLWRIPGSAGLRVTALGPEGARVPATAVAPAVAPSWDRPGDAWTSTLRIPAAGCWRINATRGRVHGDIWLQIG